MGNVKQDTHPLMPGIRCSGLNDPNWPRTLHDSQITGFSPLNCSMAETPSILAEIDVGGDWDWVESVVVAGESMLLICDGRLRLVTLAGEIRWESPVKGTLHYVGDLSGSGEISLLVSDGPRLSQLDILNGRLIWSMAFDPPHVQLRISVGNILSGLPGLEAAVFLAYGDEGFLYHFPTHGEPEVVWQRPVVLPDEWQERFDHGCDIKLDLSVPGEPVIWNIRHHRCRCFDARTGEIVSILVYRIGDQHLRNYGPWDFAHDSDGSPLIAVVSENVQKHVHAIRLRRDRDCELAWSHYYGEQYAVPGVAVEHLCIADIDGDGATEIVYNVRDPALDYRSFVRVRSVSCGTVKGEIHDAWCGGVGPDNTLLVFSAPEGSTPNSGDVTVYSLDASGAWSRLAELPRVQIPGGGVVADHLILRQSERCDSESLVQYQLVGDSLPEVGRIRCPWLSTAARCECLVSDGKGVILSDDTEGALSLHTFSGRFLCRVPLSGGLPPSLSASDMVGDGRAVLIAATAGHRVRLFSHKEAGQFEETANYEFLGTRSRHSPEIFDLLGDGSSCLIAPGSDRDGDICVRAWHAGTGSLLWETSLGISTAQEGQAVSWIAGKLLPNARSGIAISLNNNLRNIEGTFLLDGISGNIMWRRGDYWRENQVRPFLSHGLPTLYDFDEDGLDEITIDMLSYMALVRGSDGAFTFLNHTRNLGAEGALYAGDLYNSYVPVFLNETDARPHWFVPVGGFGSFGLMRPDPRQGIWREDPGYDIPEKIGLVDVDGDGSVEVGYSLKNHVTFYCRDLFSGKHKWQIELPEIPVGPVLTCDVDGDGRGEFLVDRWCIGTDQYGIGEIRWESPVPLGWAAIADIDGDGIGEIACPGRGRIVILKGNAIPNDGLRDE